jgi:hypothetical protein
MMSMLFKAVVFTVISLQACRKLYITYGETLARQKVRAS